MSKTDLDELVDLVDKICEGFDGLLADNQRACGILLHELDALEFEFIKSANHLKALREAFYG